MNRIERTKLFRNIDIYPVISSEFCAGRNPVDALKAIADGGAKIVQMREKNTSDRSLFELGEKFRAVTLQYKMLLIIDDRIDVAAAIDADGVHLGQDDLPLEAARTVSDNLIVGISTHSFEEAMCAQEAGADYINIGPIFATRTKTLSYSPLGTQIIGEIAPALRIPFTVMGGIKEKHIPELSALGASRIAMVTEITEAADITDRIKELRKLFLKKDTVIP
ncbi:MAG: thiamine-phosphate diphosphorylase [Lentisphaerae bacterium GWF2_45_14]|nr:MAG: thiamine-phosphate diphosphorylase [Lentisphaerae bacterium GWF2_45_14]